jgi:ABC-type polysaccharide/polyol phosphate export permease
MAGMHSLLGNSSIAKKVYFPREVLPLAAVLAQFVNFLLALIPMTLVLLFSGITPNGYALLLPIIFLTNILFLMGIAMFLSVAVLYFRDLMVIMEVLLQAWFFLSPVIYTMRQVYGNNQQIVYWLNPEASFIESYRTLLFFNYPPELGFTLRTCLTGVVTFAIGYVFFMWKRKRIGEML